VIGVGSTFYVDLPNLSASISDQDPGGRLPRILVCEDEPDVATAIRLFLESANYAVDVAYSGGEALELLAQTKYTAMTLDIMLPDTDGVSLIRRIRAQDETRDIPIVVVSARANETRLELNGDGVGVIDWLSKPIDEVAFAATLRRAVSNDGKRRRILHVEDDRDLTQVVSNLVGDYAEVVWADRISSARRHLARDNFDLIILDLTLPDGSGEELLGDLQTPDGQPIPVIVFSADDASAKLAGRIQAALVKSRSTEEMLLNTIRSFIAKSELPDPTNNDLSPQDNQ
jgi:DNA-binding response OmpR family regulator